MRVVNLSQRPDPIVLDIVQSSAVELLMSILAMGDLEGTTKDVNTYDVGKERLGSGAPWPLRLVTTANRPCSEMPSQVPPDCRSRPAIR